MSKYDIPWATQRSRISKMDDVLLLKDIHILLPTGDTDIEHFHIGLPMGNEATEDFKIGYPMGNTRSRIST